MSELLLEHYLVIKSLHIISVIAWMAGLLYLPRLFVYHCDSKKGSELSETLKIMERKLLKIIMNPAMISTWIFGILMLFANPALLEAGWMHAKLALVVILTGIHHIYARFQKSFYMDENKKTAKTYRIWNEIPALITVLIVIMAVVEPF